MPKKFIPKKRTFRKKTVAKKPKVSAPVRQYVKRAIHKEIENKISFYTQQNLSIAAYNTTPNMNVATMIPYVNITQGTGQQNRIGNMIRTRKCMFSYALAVLPYNAASNPIPVPQDVLIFFGKIKGDPVTTPGSGQFANLWQEGSGSRAPYNNHCDNLQLVNADLFKVYKILRHKIGYGTYTGTSAQGAPQYYSNNDYKFSVTRKLDLTRYLPKTVKFNDTASAPTNDNLFMWVMCNPADGSTASVGTYPVKLTWQLNYVFEDA